ncbi:O-antigen ligase family protein [Tindallia californiensis]|uniref:O-Antigen ligase n=1 Tax=Tindallia californiensis TaxID=159292 RepID=A0A1H3PDT1_9FIRM|nr:O-antigen ligase family protein [Tindallia californiensis]SDY99198.1 O-Antigen ligase [Tindallia californiensis]
MKKQKPKRKPSSTPWLRWSLCLIMILAPLFRGAFFADAILLLQVSIFLLMLCWLTLKVVKKETLEIRGPFHWILLLITLAYLIPVITGKWFYLEESIGMILWYLSLAGIFLMTHEVAETSSNREKMTRCVIGLVLLLSAIAWFSLAGFFHYTDAVLAGRLASTFQYPNTLAALTMSAYFLSLGEYQKTENPKEKKAFMAIAWTFFITLILTYSRIGWLLFPLLAFIYWSMIPREKKTSLAGVYLIHFCIALTFLSFHYQILPDQGKSSLVLLIGLLLGMGANSGLQYLMGKGELSKVLHHPKRKIIGIAFIAFIGAATYFLLPETIAERISHINLDQRSAYERFEFSRNAFTIFWDQPLTGSGGGGWEARYEAFQTQPYTSRTAHSFLFQTMVEAGILGTVALFILGGTLLFRLLMALRNKEVTTLSLVMAILSLLIYSILDFHLNFFSVAVILWIMIALIPWRLEYKMPAFFTRSLSAAVLLLILIPAFLLSGVRLHAYRHHQQGVEALNHHQNMEKAQHHLQKSVTYNPFHPMYRSHRAVVAPSEESIAMIEQGLIYAPNHERLSQQAIRYYLAANNKEKLEKYVEQYINHRPIKPQAYAYVANALNKLAMIEKQAGNVKEAEALYQKTISLMEIFDEKTASLTFSIEPAEEFIRSIQQAQKEGEALKKNLKIFCYPTSLFAIYRVEGR